MKMTVFWDTMCVVWWKVTKVAGAIKMERACSSEMLVTLSPDYIVSHPKKQ
jgi:hypothetical protein